MEETAKPMDPARTVTSNEPAMVATAHVPGEESRPSELGVSSRSANPTTMAVGDASIDNASPTEPAVPGETPRPGGGQHLGDQGPIEPDASVPLLLPSQMQTY
jgi:hypothetical protein